MATFTNQATLHFNGTVVSSNIVTGQVVSPLAITKTPVVDTYYAGDSVTYVVSVVNSGSQSFEALTLQDDLGALQIQGQPVYPLAYVPGSALYFVNGTRQPAPQVTGTAPLEIAGLSVPAGGSATLIYETTVTGFAPLTAGSSITNTVEISGAGVTPQSAQAVITILEGAELTIAKGLSPTTVEENGMLTYTFTIQNRGNLPAEEADGLVITDQFDPILQDLVLTVGGQTAQRGADYTYDQATGLLTTTAGRITVPAAVFAQDAQTGQWLVTPGETVVTVQGRIS